MFCPKCFAKGSVYFKREWRMAIAFVCLDCGCYLMDQCPHCTKGVSYVDKPLGYLETNASEYLRTCHNCFNALGSCNAIEAPEQVLEVQQQFHTIMEEGLNHKFIYTISYFDVLHRIASLLVTGRYRLVAYNRDRLIPFIDHIYTHHGLFSLNKPSDRGPVQLLPVHDRALILMMAHWLLDKWPRRFLRLCKLYHLTSTDVFFGFTDTVPFWFWEPVYTNLPSTFKRPLPEVPFGLKSIFEKPRNRNHDHEKKKKTREIRRRYHGGH